MENHHRTPVYTRQKTINMPKRRSISIVVCVLLASMICACAAKVKSRHMVPAKFNVTGIKRLAIADFKARFTDWNRSGAYISQLIRDELYGSEFYEMVSEAPSIDATSVMGWDSNWRLWGEKHEVDAILTGTVSQASVRHTRKTRREVRKIKTGRFRHETYWEHGEQKTRRVDIEEKRVFHMPVIETVAKLRVDVALFDVSTEIRRSSNTYKEYESEEYEGSEIKYMPSDIDMLQKMARKVARDIATDLVPHAVVQNLSLASDGECKEGNKLAQKGQWDAAIESWKAVLSANPQSHAALYNLGVAAEVARQYMEAEKYYLSAIEIQDKRMYRKALQRVGEKIRQDEMLKKQLEGR